MNTSGTWTDAADVLTPNADGYSVGTHLFITAYSANNANKANKGNGALVTVVTGFAANGSGPSVPDGGTTVTLLCIALVGIGSVRRALSC